MKPIRFSCETRANLAPDAIAARILEVEKWNDFRGYGPIPGIRSAAFEVRTPEIVGSRIRVTNKDGSTHVEEIRQWLPSSCVRLRMGEFSRPLSLLAARFDESWEFRPTAHGTEVRRVFELEPTSPLARPLLILISFFLRRAVSEHLRTIDQDVRSPASP